MSRKNKIIVSIVGIFIVLLGLVGVTYGYFLTKISGNTNDNSIYITTSNLRLVYEDVEQNGYALGTIVANDIKPGEEIAKMKFTVTNEGDSDTTYDLYLENVINTFVNKEDLELKIFCEQTIGGEAGWDCGQELLNYNIVFPSSNSKLFSHELTPGETASYTLAITYKETYEDQSEDMGKEIQGKIQIYNPEDIIDITGEITGYQDGYYIEMHSETKTSQINLEQDGETNKYTYKITGIKPGNHTIYVMQKDSDGNVSEIASKNIVVSLGTEESVSSDGTNIVMTKSTETVTVNIIAIDTVNKTLTLEGTESTSSTVDPFGTSTLAYNIINNIQNGTLEGKTTYTENLSAEGMVDNTTVSTDKILSAAEDDYGTTYYFRGNPIDNYVEFANMCWRIVRIQGDGSVKLILASELSCSEENLTESSGYATDGENGAIGTILTAHYGYKILNGYYINDYINSEEENSTSARTQLNSWLNRKITSEEQNKLKNDTWCIGDLTNAYSWDDTGEIVGTITEMISNGEAFYYTAGNKYWVTKTPSYKCETTGVDGETDTNKVGMLTFDEIIYAGGFAIFDYRVFNYLKNNATTNYWWSLSPSYFLDVCGDGVFCVGSDGDEGDRYVLNSEDAAFRPTVSLAIGTEIISNGEGTISNPYVIK